MKLLTTFNHTFAAGYSLSSSTNPQLLALWNLIKNEISLNGLYLALSDYLQTSHIGINSSNQVLTWYNMLSDGNYLYSTNSSSAPILVEKDSQFNDYPSLDFNNINLNQLLYRFPVNVGTLIIVYLTRQSNSYLIYAPRSQPTGSGSILYDAFPRSGDTLWANETLTNGSIYHADSYINGRPVLPSTYVPLNRARVLAVTNIANPEHREVIQGYGGKYGEINGTDSSNLSQSVQGKIAAIITFENIIDSDLLTSIELLLGQTYINYQGIALTSIPSFKTLVDTSFAFDFSTIAVDDFYDIISYELLSPLGVGISFTGSVLAGTFSNVYNGTLTIAISNSASMTKNFTFDLVVCRKDPLIATLPRTDHLNLVLSANKASSDNALYGLTIDTATNQVVKWEDARRITSGVYNNNVAYLAPATDAVKPDYIVDKASFNHTSVVNFNAFDSLVLSAGVSAKTFLWIYEQDSYGNRPLLSSFPDTKGNGELWTIANTSQTHGQTPVTKLITKVNRIGVNTLSYKLPLSTLSIITAVQPDDVAISFSGIGNLRGSLAFFASWDVKLTDSELYSVIATLAVRYFPSLAPYIFSEATEYRFLPSVSVDLTKKVTDLQSLTLTYDLLTPIYDSAIDSNGVLTVTGLTDEVLSYSIDVSNTIPLTSTFTFDVDITLKTNSLYLDLKNLLGTSAFNLILIVEPDSTTVTGDVIVDWNDYRLNGTNFTSSTVKLDSLYQLDGKQTASFALDGSSAFSIATPISGRGFIVGYIRKSGSTDRAFLFGQTTNNEFSSGVNGAIFDAAVTTANILSKPKYVNGVAVASNYVFTPEVFNTVIFNSGTALSFDTIASDRMFTDRSVKGYIPCVVVLNRELTADESKQVNRIMRNYYDSTKYIFLAHFDSTIEDASPRNKTLTTNATVVTSVKKFGGSSLLLTSNSICRYVEIPNDTDFAFLNEDFTISFWLNLNKPLNSGDTQIVYNQSDFQVYLKNSNLYVGRNTLPELAIFTYALDNTFFNTTGSFHHLEIVKKDNFLYLFVDGAITFAQADVYEYRDFNSPIKLGQTANLITTTGYNCYLDEFLVYRRNGLHTNTFTVPSSPYV